MRLYLVSGIAGAIEPCGCVKDMLGGVDHFAALLKNDPVAARLVLGAGPMLFMDPALKPKQREQDLLKARALGDALASVKVAGWAPAANDWAGGEAMLREIAGDRLALFAANLPGSSFARGRVFEVGGERVGVVGVSAPWLQAPSAASSAGPAPAAPPVEPRAVLAEAATWLKEQGARILVALVALPRGEALRLAETVPGFQVMLLGKPVDHGEGNDAPTPPVRVGETLVVEATNHLQSVAVVDLFVKDGRYSFADGSGIEIEERRVSLLGRANDLRVRLGRSGISADDRRARQRDLEEVQESLANLTQRSLPQSSAFRYERVEIREKLGSEPASQALLARYYREVNDHNRVAFKDVLPPPVPPGESSYTGIEGCTSCHQSERAFWDKTPHHAAYDTLEKQNKQFNLECVSCHVTGYEAPGGTTVAHVDGLTDVQCEVCHGPGSRHVQNPADPKLISVPDRSFCGPKCHHVPHVHADWSVDAAWKVIVGKGHQRAPKGG